MTATIPDLNTARFTATLRQRDDTYDALLLLYAGRIPSDPHRPSFEFQLMVADTLQDGIPQWLDLGRKQAQAWVLVFAERRHAARQARKRRTTGLLREAFAAEVGRG